MPQPPDPKPIPAEQLIAARVQGNLKLFNEEIQPVLERAQKLAQRYGFSMVSLCEVFPTYFAKIHLIQPEASFAMRLADGAMRCGGNIDLLVANLAKWVDENSLPHDSEALVWAGLDRDPSKRTPKDPQP